jgi:ABC-2 type transport system permease protein
MEKINWIGLWTVYWRETKRFLKVYNQTLVGPIVTSLLFLSVFSLAMRHHITKIEGVPFEEFMAAGLIIMAVIQNAFANTSSSLTMCKVLGYIIDYLTPPLSPLELLIGMITSAVTRGVLVGLLVGGSILFFIDLHIYHIGYVIFHLIFASIVLALLGIVAGIIADSFDQMSAFTTYIITPLAFLSGTFYSVKRLPEFWYNISHINPFFYMIDGFRYGMTGYHDGDLLTGILYLVTASIVLSIATYVMLSKGYRIKT